MDETWFQLLFGKLDNYSVFWPEEEHMFFNTPLAQRI